MSTLSIGRALRYTGGSHTVEDVESAIKRGELQDWQGEHSRIVTEIVQTPQQKILLFFLAEGNLQELRAMAPPLLEWGRQIGCMKAQFIGRAGWTRTWLVQDGWKQTAVMMEHDL